MNFSEFHRLIHTHPLYDASSFFYSKRILAAHASQKKTDAHGASPVDEDNQLQSAEELSEFEKKRQDREKSKNQETRSKVRFVLDGGKSAVNSANIGSISHLTDRELKNALNPDEYKRVSGAKKEYLQHQNLDEVLQKLKKGKKLTTAETKLLTSTSVADVVNEIEGKALKKKLFDAYFGWIVGLADSEAQRSDRRVLKLARDVKPGLLADGRISKYRSSLEIWRQSVLEDSREKFIRAQEEVRTNIHHQFAVEEMETIDNNSSAELTEEQREEKMMQIIKTKLGTTAVTEAGRIVQQRKQEGTSLKKQNEELAIMIHREKQKELQEHFEEGTFDALEFLEASREFLTEYAQILQLPDQEQRDIAEQYSIWKGKLHFAAAVSAGDTDEQLRLIRKLSEHHKKWPEDFTVLSEFGEDLFRKLHAQKQDILNKTGNFEGIPDLEDLPGFQNLDAKQQDLFLFVLGSANSRGSVEERITEQIFGRQGGTFEGQLSEREREILAQSLEQNMTWEQLEEAAGKLGGERIRSDIQEVRTELIQIEQKVKELSNNGVEVALLEKCLANTQRSASQGMDTAALLSSEDSVREFRTQLKEYAKTTGSSSQEMRRRAAQGLPSLGNTLRSFRRIQDQLGQAVLSSQQEGGNAFAQRLIDQIVRPINLSGQALSVREGSRRRKEAAKHSYEHMIQANGGKLYGLLEQLKNGGNITPVFEKLQQLSFGQSNESFVVVIPDKKFVSRYEDTNISDTGFVFSERKGIPQIVIKQGIYDALIHGDDLEETIKRGLEHEIYHTQARHLVPQLFLALGKEGKSFLEAELKKIYGKKKTEGRWFKKGLKSTDMAEEFIASALAGGYDADFTALQSEVMQRMGADAWKNITDINQENFIRNLQLSIHEGSTRVAGETADLLFESNPKKILDPKQDRTSFILEKYQQKRKYIDTKLGHVRKMHNITGKEEFIQSIEENISDMDGLIQMPTDENLKEAEEVFNELDQAMDTALSKVAGKETEELGYMRDLLDNTTFLSLADIGQIWTTFSDFMARRHERKSKRRSGEVGKGLTAKTYRTLSGEYDKEVQSAEKEEVSKYQEAHDNKDAWEIYEVIDRTSNPDEFKAAMRILADKGRIEWTKKEIWKALQRLGAGVRFYKKDAYNQSALAIKMQRAFAHLYDNDEYRDLMQKNRDNYDSKRESFTKEADEDIEILTEVTRDMLVEHRRTGRVEPPRYEAYIDLMITKGKASPERAMYYIIMGVAEGLLTKERATWFDSKRLNDVPLLQKFFQPTPTIDEFRQWGEMFHTDNGVMPQAFIEWIHYDVQLHSWVLDRTLKEASAKKWDHDFMQNIAAIGNAKMAETITGTDNDGVPNFRATAYPNVMVGILQHFGVLWRHKSKINDAQFRSEIARQIGYFTSLEGHLKGRVNNRNNHYKISASELKRRPRMISGEFVPETLGTDFMGGSRDIVKAIDPEFFNILFNDQYIGTEELENKNFEENVKPYIETHFSDVLAKKKIPMPTTMHQVYVEFVEELVKYKIDPDPRTGVGKKEADKNLEVIMNAIPEAMRKMNARQYYERDYNLDKKTTSDKQEKTA